MCRIAVFLTKKKKKQPIMISFAWQQSNECYLKSIFEEINIYLLYWRRLLVQCHKSSWLFFLHQSTLSNPLIVRQTSILHGVANMQRFATPDAARLVSISFFR